MEKATVGESGTSVPGKETLFSCHLLPYSRLFTKSYNSQLFSQSGSVLRPEKDGEPILWNGGSPLGFVRGAPGRSGISLEQFDGNVLQSSADADRAGIVFLNTKRRVRGEGFEPANPFGNGS